MGVTQSDSTPLIFKLHPMARPAQQKRTAIQNDAKLQAALADLRQQAAQGKKPNVSAAARAHSIPCMCGTLRNRFLGKTLPAKQAHADQQYLSPQGEKALVEWLLHLGVTSQPACRRQIRAWVQNLNPKEGPPSRKWIYRFLGRHPELKFGKPSGLDPKRASAFNEPVVKKFIELNKNLQEKYGVKPKNLYNMDEKGCQ
jgi:hypothetical protein